MQIVRLNAGPQTGVGATSTAFLHDPTNPTQKSSPGVKLYLQIMKRYLPSEDPKAVAHIYGMMAAYTMVAALKGAGKNPTRASLLRAAQHLDIANPFLLPGLRSRRRRQNYFPIGEDISRPLQERLLERPRKTTHDLVNCERRKDTSTNERKTASATALVAAARSRRSRSRAPRSPPTPARCRSGTRRDAGQLGVDDDPRHRSAGDRPDRRRQHLLRRRLQRSTRPRLPARQIGTVEATAFSRDDD